MTEKIFKYGDLLFMADFAAAEREDGSKIIFTRTERKLLQELCANPNAIRTRDQLLDASTGEGSDASDRNIDFAINRLRRKLNDNPRNPRFIATRYGEGYVWIAERGTTGSSQVDAFLVLGPVRGRGNLTESPAATADAFVDQLLDRLRGAFASPKRVAFQPDAHGVGERTAVPAEFSIEVAFLETGSALHCALALKRRSDAILRAERLLIETTGDDDNSVAEVAAALVDRFAETIWASSVDSRGEIGPSAEPLPVRMHNAAEAFGPLMESWKTNESRLRRALVASPDDPVTRLMLATNIHSRFVLDGWRDELSPERRRADEDEIETLVVDCIDRLQSDPHHALSAAKLLFFIGRGYRRMAVDLAEEAFARATALGHACALMGQMRGFLGDLDGALSLLSQARDLSRPGSEADAYCRVLACQVRAAAGDRDGVARDVDELCRLRPLTRQFFLLTYAPPEPDRVPIATRLILRLLSPERARAMLTWVHYVNARLYSDVAHSENVMRGMIELMRRRFGESVVPAEIAAALPGALAAE